MTYYNEIAKGYNELHSSEQKRKAKLILQNIQVKKTDKLLDVGCGTGVATELFLCEKIGIDPAKELVKQTKFEAKIGVAENLPFLDKSFEIVISITAIQNFDNIKQGILEIKRVAKRDVIITTLKKSPKLKEIDSAIRANFKVTQVLFERHDVLYFCVV